MKAWDIIGYSFDADMYCVECTCQMFACAESKLKNKEDSEGNEIHPIFAGSEDYQGSSCGRCGSSLDD